MKKSLKLGLIIGLIAALAIPSSVALAALGDTVTSFTPTPAGNGRAVAFDGTDLYYTYFGSNSIYKVATDGTAIDSMDTGVQIGALAWDSKNNQLWAASYDGNGNVYTVDWGVGLTFQFAFNPETGPHYDGFLDGLDYDERDGTLYISEDWDHKVYHVSTTGTMLHSWDVTIPGYDYLDNSDIEKVNKWLFVGHPGDTPHGPAANKIYIFEIDQYWNLIDTGASIDAGLVEGLALGEYNGQSVLWTNNAVSNEIIAYDLTGYSPVLTVDKWVYEQVELDGDGDGIIEVGEEWQFNIVIEITNVSVGEVTEILLKDNLGGDLILNRVLWEPGNWVPVVQPTAKKKQDNVTDYGPFTIEWTGKTKKAHLYIDVGSLDSGEWSGFFQLDVSTDTNPGGHQEWTSEGPTELNSGATAKGLLQGWYEVESVSTPIEVEVLPIDLD